MSKKRIYLFFIERVYFWGFWLARPDWHEISRLFHAHVALDDIVMDLIILGKSIWEKGSERDIIQIDFFKQINWILTASNHTKIGCCNGAGSDIFFRTRQGNLRWIESMLKTWTRKSSSQFSVVCFVEHQQWGVDVGFETGVCALSSDCPNQTFSPRKVLRRRPTWDLPRYRSRISVDSFLLIFYLFLALF